MATTTPSATNQSHVDGLVRQLQQQLKLKLEQKDPSTHRARQ